MSTPRKSRPATGHPAEQASRRGPGRPSLGEAERTKVIQIRVTAAEAATIRQRAESAGLSVSDYGRERLLRDKP